MYLRQAHLANAALTAIMLIWQSHSDPFVRDMLRGGTSLMEAGHLEGALDVFDRLVQLQPSFAEGWNKKATVSAQSWLLDLVILTFALRHRLQLQPCFSCGTEMESHCDCCLLAANCNWPPIDMKLKPSSTSCKTPLQACLGLLNNVPFTLRCCSRPLHDVCELRWLHKD